MFWLGRRRKLEVKHKHENGWRERELKRKVIKTFSWRNDENNSIKFSKSLLERKWHELRNKLWRHKFSSANVKIINGILL